MRVVGVAPSPSLQNPHLPICFAKRLVNVEGCEMFPVAIPVDEGVIKALLKRDVFFVHGADFGNDLPLQFCFKFSDFVCRKTTLKTINGLKSNVPSDCFSG